MLRRNHFRLVTLGRLTLLGHAGEEDASLARRRAKLALLAVLAMARRPVARDVLLEMFWGDQEEARARHSLSNALSSLRRTLGQHAITTREAEVALASDIALEVDALEFADAIERQEYGRAIELYGGHFLEAVHLDETSGFDQWVSRERRRLESLFIKASTEQCALLARAGRWSDCGSVAARWLEIEPLSSDAAVYLLNARRSAGTRVALARALEDYERLRGLIAREYDLAPGREVMELAAAIREQLASTESSSHIETRQAPDASRLSSVLADSSGSAAAAIVATTSSAEIVHTPPVPQFRDPLMWRRSPYRARVVWRGWIVAGSAALVGGVALLTVFFARTGVEPPSAAAAGKPVIAILTMDLRTEDSALTWLADGLPPMITGKLANNAAVDIVFPARARAVLARSGRAGHEPLGDSAARDVAHRLGATLVARGAIGRDGDQIVLDLNVHDVATGGLVYNSVLMRSSALALADEASARILAAANVETPGPRLSTLETSSLEAYQRYLRALELGQAGRLSEYIRELDAALALDSGFFAALRARTDAAISQNDTARVRLLRERMRRHADRATEFDRMEQAVNDAFYSGERERSEALARALVRRYPRDPRAYHLLQMVLGLHGRFDEAEAIARQGIALDSLGIEAGTGPCAQCVGFSTIVNLHWIRGDFDGAAQWARRWIRAQPDGASAWATLAWTYSYMQRPDSALPLMSRAISLSGGDAWAQVEFARMLLVARRHALADSVIATMETSTSPERRERGADLRALLERERGRVRRSDSLLDSLMIAAPAARGYAEMTRAGNLRMLGDYLQAARRFEMPVHAPAERLTLPLPPESARAFCWHHALAADAYAATRDTIRLRAYADTLQAGCSRSYYGRDWTLHHHVRGLIAAIGGRHAVAEREFARAMWTRVEGWGRVTVELANAQAAQGRPQEAIATLRTAYATRLDAMGRYVPISELDYRMARLFAEAGLSDSARVYAGYVRAAWRDADPEIARLEENLTPIARSPARRTF